MTPKSLGKQIAGSLLVTLVCLVMQHVPNTIESLVAQPCSFTRKDKLTWIADVSNLPNGIYFVSVGRPRGACHLRMDGALLVENSTPLHEVSSDLFVGAGFAQTATEHHSKLTLDCETIDGFGTRLFHRPVVATYFKGFLLHMARIFADSILGPIFCLVLMTVTLASILNHFPSRPEMNRREVFFESIKTNWTLLVFSISATLYSLSLAYFTRLFLPGLEASMFHVAVKHLFTLTAILALSRFIARASIATTLQVLNFALWIAIAFFHPNVSISVYDTYQLPIIAGIIGVMCAEFQRSEARTRHVELLKLLSAAWCVTLVLDVIKDRIGTYTYTGPSIIALITTCLAYAQIKDGRRSRRIADTAARISSAINSKISLTEILGQLAMITVGNTHFRRVSAYIDGFSLGLVHAPHQEFIRVTESGYKKETSKDARLLFADGRGTKMSRALETQEITLQQGQRDGAWFIVVPLGKHAAINLSDDRASSKYDAYESEETLKLIHPTLKTLDSRIVSQSFSQGAALQKLRSIKGDGSFQCEIGSIFVDINDYSNRMDRYGQPFAEFVNNYFLPALVKTVAHVAAPEFLRGDEAYLLILKELLPEGMAVQEGILETLGVLNDFLDGEGARLCELHGYEPFKMSMGACLGTASLVCDPLQIRTAGISVNSAKRLQDAAGSGSALIKVPGLSDHYAMSILGEEVPVLVKKNFILANKVRWRNLNKVRSEWRWAKLRGNNAA